MKLKQIPWMLAAGLTLSAAPALAQDAAPAEATTPAPAPEVTKAQLDALQKLIEAQTKRLEALEKAGEAASEKAKELEAQLAAAEEERMDLTTQMMEAQDTGEKIFSIFGFMDAGFGYFAYEEGNLLSTYIMPKPSFVTSNVNLYFKSQLTSQLETLIETRFTFAPNGEESSFPTAIQMGGVTVSETGEYVRQSGTATDRLTNASFNWGGVVIERAHIDYKPFEWLKLRLGRFLTPYGIWNVDHGSPVLIGTSLPQLVSNQLVPNNQTGLQIFGRVFPTESMRLDYAAFVSNGRGPTEAVYDLDANKAVGGRAKLSLNFGELDAAIGAFGYYGKYTDASQKIVIKANADLTPDLTADSPIGTERTIIEEYDEAAFAADIDLRAYGFRLFGEFILRKVTYDVRPDANPVFILTTGARLGSSIKQPNFVAKAGYAILTYDLGLDFLKQGMFVRPYFGFERIVGSDASNADSYSLLRMGTNLHPNPYMVVKLQVVRFMPDATEVLGPFWGVTSQVAVSF